MANSAAESRFDRGGGGTEARLIVTDECLRAAVPSATIFRRLKSAAMAENTGVTGNRAGRAGPALDERCRCSASHYAAAPAARAPETNLVAEVLRMRRRRRERSGGGDHVRLSSRGAEMAWRDRRNFRCGSAPISGAEAHRAQAFRQLRPEANVAVSKLVRDDLISEFGLAPEMTVTIYMAASSRNAAGRPDQTERATRFVFRKKFVIPESARVVFSSAMDSSEKGGLHDSPPFKPFFFLLFLFFFFFFFLFFRRMGRWRGWSVPAGGRRRSRDRKVCATCARPSPLEPE